MPLQVHSIFESFDGEVNAYHQGRRAIFLRLAGCNLRCAYCDTVRAQETTHGDMMPIEMVAQNILERTPTKLTITGGEPLIQQEGVIKLIHELWRAKPGMDISIETNGTQAISSDLCDLNDVSIIMDCKLPGAKVGEHSTHLDIQRDLGRNDWVKFVITDEWDYAQAVAVVQTLQSQGCQARMAFSPLHGKLDPAQLAEWISVSPLKSVVLNLQLHKYIWPKAGEEEER